MTTAVDTPKSKGVLQGKSFKGPKGRPFVGVLPDVAKEGNFLSFISKMWRIHGDNLYLNLGKKKMYFVIHPEDARHVMQVNHRNYMKDYEGIKDFLGNGLVMVDGDFWRRQRRLMQPMFLKKTVENYFTAMTESTDTLLEHWSHHPEGQVIDIAKEMAAVTQDVIVKTMFSKVLGPQIEHLCEALEDTMKSIESQLFIPQFMRNWPLPVNLRYKAALRTIRKAMIDLVEEHKANPDEYDDLLTLLLQAEDDESGQKMDMNQIIDEITTIFFAGHETTANTLAWTWYLLSKHPDIAKKVYHEVDTVLEGRVPTAADIKELTYTTQVFEETLRMFPVAWTFVRKSVEDDVLPSGHKIPKGSNVHLIPFLTHRHPDFWENPEGFDPERFAPGAAKRRHRTCYFPFGAGQRICIGNHFSLLEGPLLIALIAQRFRLELEPGVQVDIKPMGTLRPNPNLPMFIKPRTDGPELENPVGSHRTSGLSSLGMDQEKNKEEPSEGKGKCPFH